MLVPITIQTKSSETLDPLPDVEVSVWDANYDTCFGSGLTNASGEFAVGLNTGTYKLFLSKVGFTFFPLPKTLGVETDALDVECNGVPVTEPELPAGYTYLYGTIKDISLNPSAVPVFVHLNGTPQVKDGSVLDRSTLTVTPDETGYWGVLLAGGTHITVAIPSCKFQKTGTLPFAGSLEVNDLGLYG